MGGPRFDRIVPLLTLVLVGLGVVFLLELNTDLLLVHLGEDLPSFSAAWLLLGALALVTGIGVELIARAQDRLYTSGWTTTLTLRGRPVELALPLWSVPILTPIAIFAFFRLFKGALATNAYLIVLLVTGILLTVVLVTQHYLISGREDQRRVARAVLVVIAYALAFAVFSAVTFNRYRTLYAVALIFPSTLLLAADILRGRVGALWIVAAVIAGLMVESYWALSYWPASFLVVSVTLLVVFYLLIGLAQAAVADRDGTLRLSRRGLMEYGVVGTIAVIALVIAVSYLRTQAIDLRLP
jgi:hypothetical protein